MFTRCGVGVCGCEGRHARRDARRGTFSALDRSPHRLDGLLSQLVRRLGLRRSSFNRGCRSRTLWPGNDFKSTRSTGMGQDVHARPTGLEGIGAGLARMRKHIAHGPHRLARAGSPAMSKRASTGLNRRLAAPASLTPVPRLDTGPIVGFGGDSGADG